MVHIWVIWGMVIDPIIGILKKMPKKIVNGLMTIPQHWYRKLFLLTVAQLLIYSWGYFIATFDYQRVFI
jgi:hypothetical protein